jgi:uncharacterized membrane protein YgdD (TMEM256/DUF423 family)
MMHIPNIFLRLAVANGFFVVLLGAFGAHALRDLVPASALDTWQTAVQYHMFHVTGLLAVNLMVRFTGMNSNLYWSGLAFNIGILLFCGSLYLMTLTGLRWLGMITPLGGVAFLLGWGLLFKAVLDDRT